MFREAALMSEPRPPSPLACSISVPAPLCCPSLAPPLDPDCAAAPLRPSCYTPPFANPIYPHPRHIWVHVTSNKPASAAAGCAHQAYRVARHMIKVRLPQKLQLHIQVGPRQSVCSSISVQGAAGLHLISAAAIGRCDGTSYSGRALSAVYCSAAAAAPSGVALLLPCSPCRCQLNTLQRKSQQQRVSSVASCWLIRTAADPRSGSWHSIKQLSVPPPWHYTTPQPQSTSNKGIKTTSHSPGQLQRRHSMVKDPKGEQEQSERSHPGGCARHSGDARAKGPQGAGQLPEAVGAKGEGDGGAQRVACGWHSSGAGG